MQSNNPLVIGVTGNIGSGKTTVCKMITEKYPVYFSDELAHQVLLFPQVITKLTERWGRRILTDDAIDRKKVAQIVFRDAYELDFLNKTLHPFILEKMHQIVRSFTERYIFFEVPLLFEANLEDCFDCIILVTCIDENRLLRLQNQKDINSEEIKRRLKHQIPEELKVLKADFVIDNNGDISQLSNQVTNLLIDIPKFKRKTCRKAFSISEGSVK